MWAGGQGTKAFLLPAAPTAPVDSGEEGVGSQGSSALSSPDSRLTAVERRAARGRNGAVPTTRPESSHGSQPNGQQGVCMDGR